MGADHVFYSYLSHLASAALAGACHVPMALDTVGFRELLFGCARYARMDLNIYVCMYVTFE